MQARGEAHRAGAVAKIKAVATAEGATLPPPPPTVADMTDSWRAKVTVTSEQQADCGKLAAVYDGMRDAFQRDGLNVAAIRATLCAARACSLPVPGCRKRFLYIGLVPRFVNKKIHVVSCTCDDDGSRSSVSCHHQFLVARYICCSASVTSSPCLCFAELGVLNIGCSGWPLMPCVFSGRCLFWQHAWAAHCRQFYSGTAEPQPQPLLYKRFPTPLDPGAVRLAVLQPPAGIRAAAYQAADAVVQALAKAGALDLHEI